MFSENPDNNILLLLLEFMQNKTNALKKQFVIKKSASLIRLLAKNRLLCIGCLLIKTAKNL